MDIERRPQGAEIEGDGVHYRIWAPKASRVEVEIVSTAALPIRTLPLIPGANGYFEGIDADGKAGDRYLFKLDDLKGLPDPASRWQPEGVHSASMVISPDEFEWSDEQWRQPCFRDLVIYELHIGTFTSEGTFLAAIGKLKHIRECGANAIELMPVADFAGARNWGYDGVCLFAPSRAYGHPDDLRALVNEAHKIGLAVILDVVYNHFGPDGNYLACYIGDYLDESAKTPWGGAIRYADPKFKPLRDLVLSNPGYWMREFHIDGFRLDATHAIVDDSARHILQELTADIQARGGFAIAEDPRNDARLVVPEQQGGFGFRAVWADDFHHIMRVANTGENEGYFGDFTGSTPEAVEVLRNGWLYCGQSSKSERKPRGTKCGHISPDRFIHCISNHDQTGNHAFGERLTHRALPAALRAADALLCLSPYTPLLFMGQEWAASTPFLFFTDHHPELGKLISAGRREEFKHFAAFRDPANLERIPDPQSAQTFIASKLAWDELETITHSSVLALYKTCLALRAHEPAFRPVGRDSWQVKLLKTGVGALRLNSPSADWIVIFNFKGSCEGSLCEESLFGSQNWEVILSTSEERFGGSGTCGVNVKTMQVAFEGAETVVLRALHQ